MPVIAFVLELMAATTLLMFSVHLVRTAVEARLEGHMSNRLSNNKSSVLAAVSGCSLAVMLQGATSVILLTASMAGAGYLSLASGIAVAIGADLGSAIVIRLLTLDLEWLLPILLVVGGWLKLRSTTSSRQMLGQGILGIALVLISLDLISEAALPLREAAFLPAIASYLQADIVLAVLVGTALTFALMSSVAAILFGTAVFLSGAITLPVTFAFIIGANIGSGLLPVWLLRKSPPQERLLTFVNLALRTSVGGCALLLLATLGGAVSSWASKLGPGAPIYFHLLFNGALLCVLPLTKQIARLAEKHIGTRGERLSENAGPLLTSALMDNVIELNSPKSAMRREILAMLDLVSEMLTQTPLLFRSSFESAEAETLRIESALNERMTIIRKYFTHAFQNDSNKELRKEMQVYLEYAVRLEHAGDILSKRVPRTAQAMREKGTTFSQDGRHDMMELADMALANTYVAFEVASSGSPQDARTLIREKEAFSRIELKSRKRHFKRLAAGNEISLVTSNHHLELSSCLKEVNSKIATIAYPVLDGDGQLRDTRLIS